LLVYYNLIFQRGIDKFYKDAKKAGLDAVLAADCPIEEAKPLLEAAERQGIDQVFIVSPATTEKRLEKIFQKCSGYAYLVSVLGVTGARSELQARTIELIKKTGKHATIPVCVGFGISRPEHVKQVVEAGADGAIVGSALINKVKENLGNQERMLEELALMASEMKKATIRD